MKYRYLLAAGLLSACASHPPAPVVERTVTSNESVAARPSSAVPVGGEFYTVKKGDTLYSIALEHGRDYRDVAAWNNLDNPNRIQVGQQLRVSPSPGEEPVAVAKPVTSSAPVEAKAAGANSETFKREPKGGKLPYSDEALARLRESAQGAPKAEEKAEEKPAAVPEPKAPAAPAGEDAVNWAWPAPGKVLQAYTGGAGAKEINRGVDIAGKAGDPVLAAADGVVTYVGSGIPGYGNFTIIRHNSAYLSVYANNSRVLVKERQNVVKGQKIAEVGGDADQAKLHFEIRRLGKPVDPLTYLPAR
ncbi:MAG: peptidoglycan DD-metalloendopeptidase family protein [Ignavibacteria bacterium]